MPRLPPVCAQGCGAPTGEAGERCGLATLGSPGEDALTLATASLDDCTAGSLCCAETQDALDEDCSSAGEAADEEGFTIFQSPLSLAAEAAGPRAPPPRVLAECSTHLAPAAAPHPLAGDPALAEMLR